VPLKLNIKTSQDKMQAWFAFSLGPGRGPG
jgi:hypothetical protein